MDNETRPASTRLVRKKPEIKVIDLLVVGAGPTGCTAALAAKAAGLDVRVLDRDAVWARYRDGAGAALDPDGGVVAKSLPPEYSGPAWAEALSHAGIQVQTGVELIALDQKEGEPFVAKYWARAENRVLAVGARFVLLASGCGRPFSIGGPHAATRLCKNLDDPSKFLKRPVAVVGSDRSAIQAVIALSKARFAIGDRSPIIWAGLGESLPRIPYDLQAEFHLVALEYANFTFFPKSRLLGEICDPTGQVCLSLWLGQRQEQGLSVQQHLHLAYEDVIVCNYPEVQEHWLRAMGVGLAEAAGVLRPVVRPTLESSRPGVYVAGSVLSPCYPQGVAGVGKLRLIQRPDRLSLSIGDGQKVVQSIVDFITPKAAKVAKRKTAPVIEVPPTGYFLVHLGKEGQAEKVYPLGEERLTLGKQGSDLVFPDDTMLADLHATVRKTATGHVLRDEASSTGVFLRLAPGERVRVLNGDLIRLGKQFLVLTMESGIGLVRHFDREGQEGEAYRLSEKPLVLGRNHCTVLDPNDEFLAERHLMLWVEKDGIIARDLLSPNGSFVRMLRETPLLHGQVFQVGQEQLRFVDAMRAGPPAEPVSSNLASASGRVEVTIEGKGGPYPGQPGQTLREIVAENGVNLAGDCQGGACGLDAVRIISGQENVDPGHGPLESETLRSFCGLVLGSCRLACKMRIYGPVRVKLVDEG